MIIEYSKKDTKEDLLTFLKENLKQGQKAVVDFFATWCGPCKMQIETFHETESKLSDLLVVKVDIDKFKDLPVSFAVRGVPTMFLFNSESAIIGKNVGFLNPSAFVEWVNSAK